MNKDVLQNLNTKLILLSPSMLYESVKLFWSCGLNKLKMSQESTIVAKNFTNICS